MTPSARKRRDAYALKPNTGFLQREFGLWMCLDAWYADGLPRDVDLNEFFGYEPPGSYHLQGLGWCEASFFPPFAPELLEDRGETEVVRDAAGRGVLYFKGRRHGFMPEFVSHPVTDMQSWKKEVKPRLAPDAPGRMADREEDLRKAREAERDGLMIVQNIIGPYMYLRSLIGPGELLYAFYDQPELIHDCMESWFLLADAVTKRHQRELVFDEVFFGEDICYNHGPLISPEMIREFLFPYYRRLLENIRGRQLDAARELHIQLDSDGDCRPVIELYRDELGFDAFSPFEVASGCDVLEIGRRYPELVLHGGFDKRILAAGRDAIDREIDRLFPAMRARGGYIPTCDHGVPPEVNWRDYLHFRKRCLEFS